MKILILSPHIDAQHAIVQALKARGDAVLVSNQLEEGWKVLQVHGASIDLAILHREGPTGGGDPGAELNFKIKNHSTFSDLPVLFVSEVWTDEQCAAHQQTPAGANAYLRWPFDAAKLITTIDAIFSPEASPELPHFDNTHVPTLSIIAPAPKIDVGSMVLEDPSKIFDKADKDISKSGINLSTFDGKPEGTSVKLDPKSLSAPIPAPAAQRSGASDVSKLLQPNMAPMLDLLDVSLSESSVGQPSLNPPSMTPSLVAAPSESGIDLLSVEPAPGEPPMIETPSILTPAIEAPAFQAQDFLAPVDAPSFPTSAETIPSPNASEEIGPPPMNVAPALPSELPAPDMSDDAEEDEAEKSSVENELPYLFSKESTSTGAVKAAPVKPVFSHPVGDSVVPGGAANAPDLETLKKYLLLREQDVAALSGQLKATREENSDLSFKLRVEQDRAEGLDLLADDQKKKIEEFEREKAIALEALTSEIAELRFQTKAKTDKAKLLEIQVNEASHEIERLKDRVRSDIRKIRVRERELENQLEMAKKDTEVVLGAREGKIVELKRKIDLLEFNMDLLQDRFNRERESNNKLREKLGKAAQVVRVAEGLLDEPQAANLKDAAGNLTAGKSNHEKAS
jgi:CheY-like chemotaxis protein